MTSQYRHRRTSTPATPFPTLEPGEIAVNTANRQISVGDAATPTLGTPKPLLAIRFFDIAAIYAIGDIVTNADKIWRAIVANGPGAFNAAQWELAASQVTIAADPPSNAVAGSMWWDSDNGMLYVRYNDGDSSQWVQATAMPVVDTSAFVAKAGDTMTGDLTIAKVDPFITLNRAAVGQRAAIIGSVNGLTRWRMSFGNPAAESGGNVGSNFIISRYNDVGVGIDDPITIDRSTGMVSMWADPTAALGVATKQYVDARAGDAMAYSGMQINGGMEVSQEVAHGTAVVGAAGFICDGWRFYGGFADGQGQTGAFGNEVIKHVAMNTTAAHASLATADLEIIYQNIEGYRMSRLRWGTSIATPITIAFWSAHTLPGTYCVSVQTATGTRSYVATYTQNVASAWEYKTVTVPGDTTGTWNKDNTIGLVIAFPMAAGTTYLAPSANTWNAGNYKAVAGQVNACVSAANYLRLGGVVVLPGTQAPTAAQSPLLMRPYEQELLTCQRYYQKSYSAGVNVGADASAGGLEARYIASPAPHGQVYASVSLPIKMRATPTVTIYGYHGGATKISDGAGNDLAANSGLISNPGDARFHVGNNSGISLTLPGNFIQFHWTADARL
jgi:hypothetical protein